MKAIILVVLMAASALADTTYVVRSSDGIFPNEFSPQRDACGAKTRDEIWALVAHDPVLTVTDTAMLFTTDTKDSRSKTLFTGEHATGSWNFGSKILTVSVRFWGTGDHGPKTLVVEVTRAKADDGTIHPCREVWSAIVSPSRTREALTKEVARHGR